MVTHKWDTSPLDTCLQFTPARAELFRRVQSRRCAARGPMLLCLLHVRSGRMSVETERGIGLEREGIRAARVFWNLSTPALYEEAISRREGVISADGPLVCRTGEHTGRSPNDKFIVREPSSDEHIAWGGPNRPMGEAEFDALQHDLFASLEGARRFRAGVFRRRGPALQPAGPCDQRVRVARPVRAESVHPPRSVRPGPAAADDRRFAKLQGRSRASRHQLGSRRRAELTRSASCSLPGPAMPARSRSRSSAR